MELNQNKKKRKNLFLFYYITSCKSFFYPFFLYSSLPCLELKLFKMSFFNFRILLWAFFFHVIDVFVYNKNNNNQPNSQRFSTIFFFFRNWKKIAKENSCLENQRKFFFLFFLKNEKRNELNNKWLSITRNTK